VFVCEPGVSESFLVPPGKRETQDKRPLNILTVANFLPAKGLLETLFALSRVPHIDWLWHAIGDCTCDPVYTSRFDAAARQLGLDTRIVRHGALDQSAVAGVMKDMDLFVFASRFEAYGMALAEAAAMCLPAVTTDVGAAADLYEHDKAGLVAAADDTDAFAAHLERLMSDATSRERFRDHLRLSRPRTWQHTLDDFMSAVASLGELHD
jgi:glycosyltransferase involved in cell wall biosynthesis